jgi:hypothetical protein
MVGVSGDAISMVLPTRSPCRWSARRAASLVSFGATVTMLLCVAFAAKADAFANADQIVTNDGTVHRIDRTWLYVDDATVAPPMMVVGSSNFSYTNVGSSVSRVVSPYPNTYDGFAANTAQPGGLVAVGGELGLVPRLSIAATGQVGVGGIDGVPNPSAGAVTGLRFNVSPSEWTATRVVLSVGYLREAWSGPIYDDDTRKWLPGSATGDNGAWFQIAAAGNIARLRWALTVHGEHVFWPGRDPLDVMAELGASYRVVGLFRAGVEYVGQDLEESFEAGAEGGARHFVGPVASLQLMGERVTIVAGPSIGLSSRSPSLLGRLGLSYGF